jgi:hypothetical protein
MLTSDQWDYPAHPRIEVIVNDPRFERYELVKKYRLSGFDDDYEFLYLRDDLVD